MNIDEMELIRVSYGKPSTNKKYREYRIKNCGSAVGTRKEIKDFLISQELKPNKIKFTDKISNDNTIIKYDEL